MTDIEVIVSIISDVSLAGVLLWLLVTERKRTDDTVRRYEQRHDRIVEYLVQSLNRSAHGEPDRTITRPLTRPDGYEELRKDYFVDRE